MKRAVVHIGGLVLLMLVVFAPAVFYGGGDDAGGRETTTITSYVATFDVDDDGDMEVVEKLTVDFPHGGKHGIFRLFDTTDEDHSHLRFVPHDIDVTMDGGEVPAEHLTEGHGRYLDVKIGSASSTVDPGKHVYRIRYTIDGVLRAGDNGHESQLYWDLIPGGWRQVIGSAELTVHLPADAQDTQCAVGAGSTAGCAAAGDGTRTLVVRTGELAPNTPVTVRTGLDMATPPPGTRVWWSPRLDQVLGRSLLWVLVVVGIAVVAGLGGLLLARRTREADPQLPLLYTPPEGIGPAQAAYVVSEQVGQEQYVATLMYAAERGAVGLDRQGAAWTISDRAGAQGWADLDPVTRGIAHVLGGPGTSFTATRGDVAAGRRLKTEIESFEATTRGWAASSGLVEPSGLGAAGRIVLGASLLLVGAVLWWNPFQMTLVALIPGLFLVGAAALAAPGAGTRRTRAGRDLWSRAGGFRRVLATPSAEARFDFSGRQELYTAYIPWAVAFGCADEWAEKYRIETASEPPVPSYFGSAYSGAYVGSAVSSMVGDFSSTVGSAVSSYEATQSSSSSGGGGFSGGGGGGGGGGGSW